jgi:type II secretory pathway predicted ATPase ExeA
LQGDEGQARRRESGEGAAALAAFGETSNPAEYVPREACETALRALEQAVRAGRCAALTAPPGLGKSLLLRLLERRLASGHRCLFLPYGALATSELCAWVLGLLGEAFRDDPCTELLRYARRSAEEGRVLVLLVDDASSMPRGTARELGELVRESGNRLRLVLAASDDATSSRVLAVLHPDVVLVRFRAPMTGAETRLYVEARLEQARTPELLRRRFDDETIGWIHRLSGGVPRRVHDLGRSLLDEPPEGVGSLWREERWLGAPIEETGDSRLEELPALREILAKRAASAPAETLAERAAEDDDIELL